MKRRTLPLAIIVLLFWVNTGCKSYFTHDKRNAVTSSNPKGVEKIQFYLDQDLTLMFVTSTVGEEIEGGKVTFEAGKYVWRVYFPKNTPCIATVLDEYRLKVSFEHGSSSYLVFGMGSDGKYYLYKNSLGSNGTSGVVYDGKFLEVSDGGNVALIIREIINENTTRENKVIKGIRVD